MQHLLYEIISNSPATAGVTPKPTPAVAASAASYTELSLLTSIGTALPDSTHHRL
jgi:hypothetical protein